MLLTRIVEERGGCTAALWRILAAEANVMQSNLFELIPMSYTLWRFDEKVGYTLGEVSLNPPGMLLADIQMLATYTLPAGFSQCVGRKAEPRTIDLIIDSPEDAARRELPERCMVHAGSDDECFIVREYTGPVERPTAATAFVLRDPDDHPLDMAMLRVLDHRSLFNFVSLVNEQSIPRFRLSAIFADALDVEPLPL